MDAATCIDTGEVGLGDAVSAPTCRGAAPPSVGLPAMSVVIAAFADQRWAQTLAAIRSVREQTAPATEIVLVIDHNPALHARARAELGDGVSVVANTRCRGASGARNTGIAASRGEVVVFLDDDATASPDWLARLGRHFADGRVVGVGGGIAPDWHTVRPRWLPAEFDWVVGAAYRGLPDVAAPVRNVWSGNMAVRRSALEAVDGFREGFGKTGSVSRPEDTDLCVRIGAEYDAMHWLLEPTAMIAHAVSAHRATFRFFLARCWNEGRGKAAMARLVGVRTGTSVERAYVFRTLVRGFLREALAARRDIAAAARCASMLIGLSAAAAGFFVEMVVARRPETTAGDHQ